MNTNTDSQRTLQIDCITEYLTHKDAPIIPGSLKYLTDSARNTLYMLINILLTTINMFWGPGSLLFS